MSDTVDIIKASNLSAEGATAHGFCTRSGGVSDRIYASLNCGRGSDDDPRSVEDNKARALGALGIRGPGLALVHQVHSPVVWIADGPRAMENRAKADAVVTDRPGLAVGVLTADCAPVLFADADRGVVAASHAGWRGALAGVLENTVVEMERLGARRATIRAALGPCIRQESYEVGDDLRRAFLAERPGSDRYFADGVRDGHYQFDLGGFVMDCLRAMELGSIEDTGHDTYADEARFFSYRRATHRNEPDYGRLLSLIAVKGD
ncbi:MAG: peptidoglycan editing factor PgeF [Rhodospirillaceae bacterium]